MQNLTKNGYPFWPLAHFLFATIYFLMAKCAGYWYFLLVFYACRYPHNYSVFRGFIDHK